MTYMFLLICNLLFGAGVGYVSGATTSKFGDIGAGLLLGAAFTASPVAGHLTYVYLGGL